MVYRLHHSLLYHRPGMPARQGRGKNCLAPGGYKEASFRHSKGATPFRWVNSALKQSSGSPGLLGDMAMPRDRGRNISFNMDMKGLDERPSGMAKTADRGQAQQPSIKRMRRYSLSVLMVCLRLSCRTKIHRPWFRGFGVKR